MRRGDVFAAIESRIGIPHVIGEDDDDVGFL